jgi:hypothetical protein
MKRTAFALTLAAAVLSVACGEGRAIFNVDVYSFLAGSGNDTVPYAVPPASSVDSYTVQRILLPPGLGKSIVDSVRITSGAANLITSTGAGSIGLSLYVASDSAGTHVPAALALTLPATTIPGPGTVPVPISGDLSPGLYALFTRDTLWIRIAATGTNPNAGPLLGQMALTALQLRVVMQDKIF